MNTTQRVAASSAAWLLFWSCLGAGAALAQPKANPVAPGQGIQQKAVSLRELQAKLGSPEAATLFGATWIRGFLIAEDELGKDIVLLTYEESGRPVLRLDDFAVAYHNLTESRQRPACTINPRDDTLRQLSELSRRLSQAQGPTMEAVLAEWGKIARKPQDVIVYGVSPDTHFASIMVTADYDLKNISNGADQVAGVVSLKEILVAAAKKDFEEQGENSIQRLIQNRFWFNPGDPAFYRQDDHGSVILGKCPVVLLTEEEAMTPQGRSSGLKRPHPQAQEFTTKFTASYKAIARLRPVYRELENLYRIVAITALLQESAKTAGASRVIEDLMRRVSIQRLRYDKELAGRYAVTRVEGKTKVGGREASYSLWMPSCGGVSMDVRVDEKQHRAVDVDRRLPAIRKVVLSSRPSPKAVWWYYDAPADMQWSSSSPGGEGLPRPGGAGALANAWIGP